MTMDPPSRVGTTDFDKLRQGVIYGLLISIPLWGCIGVLAVLFLLERPISEAETAALLFATIGGYILVRRLVRGIRVSWPNSVPASVPVPAVQRPRSRPLLFRQSLALSALAAAYLQYYFWEVQLQIAALNSVMVFVPVRALG